MIKAVLFDLDGTFAETAPDLAAALNHIRTMRNLPPLPLDAVRPQASHGSHGLLKLGFGIKPDAPNYDALRDIFLGHYERNICVYTRLFAGMAELIAALKQRNVAWGIVTNKPHRYTVPLVQALGYAEHATCMVSGDTCARAKPHPDPLLKACEIIGIAANAADMCGIIARYGYIGGDAQIANWGAHGIIDAPIELLDYLAL